MGELSFFGVTWGVVMDEAIAVGKFTFINEGFAPLEEDSVIGNGGDVELAKGPVIDAEF